MANLAAEPVCVRTAGSPAPLSGKWRASTSCRLQNHRPLPSSIRACQSLNDRTKFYNELGLFSLKKKIEDSVNRVEMLAPGALEVEEAKRIKQEVMIHEFNLWDDLAKSNEILVKLADSAKVVDALKDLKYKAEEAKLITELADMDVINYGLFKQAYTASVNVRKFLDKYEMSKLLKGPYDAEGACVIVEAGSEGICPEIWAEQLIKMYTKWTRKQGYGGRIVEKCVLKKGGIKSATIEFESKYVYGCLSRERGVHRLIKGSRNESMSPEASWAAVDVIPLFLDTAPDLLIHDMDLAISFHSSSEGKQRRTESAVRIQHIPTGLKVQSSGERSRFANKIKALNRLRARLLIILKDQGISNITSINRKSIINMWHQETRSFAVVRRNLKLGTLTFEKPRTMGSLKLRSVSSASSVKLSKVMGIDGEADTSIAKETDVKCTALENKNVENDPDSIQRMTVQELRKKLRSLGVPAKGCKRDLVDALKDSLHSNSSGKESLVVEDCGSPEIKPICSRNNPKRKVESLSAEVHAENISTVSKVSAVKRTKKGVKQARAEETIVDVKTKLLATKQELRTNEVTAKKSPRTKRKVPSDINSGAYVVSKMVDLPEIQYEPWTILTHKKPQKGWVPYNPRTMRPPPLTADTKHVKLMSWNVNGLRALLKLEGFSAVQLAQREDFDVLCLQETKLQEKDVEAIKCSLLEGYEDSFWTCSISKLGYSGTAIISRIKPLSVRYGLGISDHDSEGRLVTVEFDTFYLISGYVPNSGDGLRRLSYRVSEWDPSLSSYMKELEKSKPVVLTGDLNCAHEEIDIFNPAGNKRSAGFTDEERQSFEKNFLNMGFVDTFRKQHPGIVGYTYWGYRHNGRKTNKGWRLDYFLVSESIADEVYDSYILPDIGGSDHCPVGLILKL